MRLIFEADGEGTVDNSTKTSREDSQVTEVTQVPQGTQQNTGKILLFYSTQACGHPIKWTSLDQARRSLLVICSFKSCFHLNSPRLSSPVNTCQV